MKLDYNQAVTKFDGVTPYTEDGHPITLGQFMIKATDTSTPGDETRGPLGRYQIGEIGMTVTKGLDLTRDQVKLMRERCQEAFLVPSLVYAITQMLDAALAEDAAPDPVDTKAVPPSGRAKPHSRTQG